MTPADIAFRVGVVLALILGCWYIVDLIGKHAVQEQVIADQRKLLNDTVARNAHLQSVLIGNDVFDHDVRAQTGQTQVIITDARKNDPDAIALLDHPLPESLRRRVFDHDDPADTSERAPEPTEAREN